MSATEREALDAGTVWWDGELFTGGPNWQKLMSAKAPTLTAAEQAFLDGPCEDLCAMLDDWDITHRRADLSPEVWNFIKSRGFFGMIVPRRYGGLEFSAYAHSCVLVKIASRSGTASSTIAVPNSLGPAELLLHYGTEAQKNHFLPRLARGEEVPCFALTGPRAGSDAASLPDTGVICRRPWQGTEIIGIRLNFSKRYITLAPVATVVGLAFRLFDPDKLMGEKADLGITCALIPRDTPGVTIGRRHFPMNVPFQNGPIQGHDVFVPIDAIIGGFQMAGQGWRMLVEQLSVGRCISLPSSAAGGAQAAVYASAAYARIRRQFNMPIGRFEGVEQVLARMAARSYIVDAARSVTAGAIDGGEKPSVPSAMLKYHATEFGRMIANDAMDVHGGKGICLGPNNYLARGYQIVPIGITVEGANILTRSLIIFGQGAIRCHPFVLREMNAARNPDREAGVAEFDRALMGHVGFAISNAVRSLVLGLTLARFTKVPRDRRDDALLPAHQPLQRVVRAGHRHRHARARRLPQEEGKLVRAFGRRVVDDVPGIDGVEAPRESGPRGGGSAAGRMGLPRPAVSGPGTTASVSAQFSESAARGIDAAADLSARTHLLRAERPSGTQHRRSDRESDRGPGADEPAYIQDSSRKQSSRAAARSIDPVDHGRIAGEAPPGGRRQDRAHHGTRSAGPDFSSRGT